MPLTEHQARIAAKAAHRRALVLTLRLAGLKTGEIAKVLGVKTERARRILVRAEQEALERAELHRKPDTATRRGRALDARVRRSR